MFEVLDCVVQKHAVLLEKGIDLHAGLETEQTANLGFGEAVAAVRFQSDRFEGHARRVLSRSDQLTGQFFRNLNGESHRPLSILPVPPREREPDEQLRQLGPGATYGKIVRKLVIVITGIYYALGMAAAGAFITWLVSPWAAIPLWILALFCLYFFRDPEREIPSGPVAVSPADGKVVAVKLETPT